MRNVLRFALIVCALVTLSSCATESYETGYVTKGNPDNSYLDTCKVYCCGD